MLQANIGMKQDKIKLATTAKTYKYRKSFVHLENRGGKQWQHLMKHGYNQKLANHVTTQECQDTVASLRGNADISEALDIIRLLCVADDFRDAVPDFTGGCLYLPSNAHLNQVFDYVEQPTPLMWIEIFKEWFFSHDNNGNCPHELAAGSTATNAAGSEATVCDSGFVSQHEVAYQGACLTASAAGQVGGDINMDVFALEGLLGLPEDWEDDIENHHGFQEPPIGALSNDYLTKSVTLPIDYIICDAPGSTTISDQISDNQLLMQTEVMNQAFNGTDTCDPIGGYTPSKFNTKIKWSHGHVYRTSDSACGGSQGCRAGYGQSLLQKEPFRRTLGRVNVIFCKVANLLGFSSFPPGMARGNFINPGTVAGGTMSSFNLGKTTPHEIGHFMGLYHTFQGGCNGGSHGVEPEGSANYVCPASRNTCGGGSSPQDPYHNIMDYSLDKCMCSFTEGQTQRMWAVLEDDYKALIVDDGAEPAPTPAPTPDGAWPPGPPGPAGPEGPPGKPGPAGPPGIIR